MINNKTLISLIIYLLTTVLFSSIGIAQNSQESSGYPFEIIAKGSRCSNQKEYPKGNFIIASSFAFEDLWKSTHGHLEGIPYVDFDNYFVLAVYKSYPSSALQIKIEQIIENENSLEVYINFIINKYGFAMPTQPFVMLKIKSPEKSIEFISTTTEKQ